MSNASLTNESLYLTTLGVNNSQYSEAVGYVAKQALIGTTNNTVYMSVPDGVAIGGGLQLGNGSNVVNITNTGSSNVQIAGSLSTTGSISCPGTLQLTNGTNAVNISNSGSSNVNIAGSLSTSGSATISGGGLNLGTTPNNVLLTGTAGTLSITGQIEIDNGTSPGTGILSVNASNQLLWNGVVIS
jgi:hypothetical protein